MQVERRIGQRPVHSEIGQGRSDRAENDFFRPTLGDDETRDQNLVLGEDVSPGGDIEQPRDKTLIADSESKSGVCGARDIGSANRDGENPGAGWRSGDESDPQSTR